MSDRPIALTSRVILPQLGDEPEVEDIFSEHLAYIFSDYTPNAHGDPGKSIIYRSPTFGNISLQIPIHPDTVASSQLFAHHLWNAALVAAEGIEQASNNSNTTYHDAGSEVKTDGDSRHGETRSEQNHWDSRYWDMRGADILELGAGTALPSMIAYRAGARSLVITDHPSSPAITTSTIRNNVLDNCGKQTSDHVDEAEETSKETERSSSNLPQNINVCGYLWGTEEFIQSSGTESSIDSTTKTDTGDDADTITIENTGTKTTRPTPPKYLHVQPRSFTKIIVADCLWIPSKHAAICKSILTYLKDTSPQKPESESDSKPESESGPANKKVQTPCAIIVAGHHTGRKITSDFFALATGSHPHTNTRVHYDTEAINDQDPLTNEVKGKLKLMDIFEVDIDGNKREWVAAVSDSVPDSVSVSDVVSTFDGNGEDGGGGNDTKAQMTRVVEENREESRRWSVCGILVRR